MAIRRGLLLAVAAALASASAVLATDTSVGLTSTLLGRGAWDRAELSDFAHELGDVHRYGGSTVAVVRASLAPGGGTTDWHGHPGPSVVVVTAGTIRVVQAAPGGCTTTEYVAGEAFYHSESAHNFINPSSTVAAEFLVTYFAPAGGLLTHTEPAC